MGTPIRQRAGVTDRDALSAWLERIEAKLDRVLELLERHDQGARDREDERLPLAVIEAVRDRPFTSAQLLAHAEADENLGAAITACDVTNARELGKLLRRLEGLDLHGVRLERVDERHRDGIVWRVQVCDC